MRRLKFGVLVVYVGLVCGCGGSLPESSKFASAPHGGQILELPDSLGFVELKTERESPAGGRKALVKSRILAYFYQTDSTTPMSPGPTDVKVTLGAGNAVALIAQSKEPGQFASEPGDFSEALRGQIDCQVGGKPVTATFMFR